MPAGRFALPGQDVHDHVGRVDALTIASLTGRLDRGQAIAEHGGEDVDHLPVAVVGAGELAPDALDRGGQDPVLEGRAVAQGAGLAGEHRHVVPGIEDRLATAEGAWMLADDAPVLADFDPVGIGTDLDRPADRARRDRVPVVVEADETGLRDRGRHGMEAVEAAGIGNQAGPLRLEHLPDRPILELGMGMRLGVGDAWSSSQAFSSS